MKASTRRKPETLDSVADVMEAMGAAGARGGARAGAGIRPKAKNAALVAAAREIKAQTAAILAANARDLAAARRAAGRRRPSSTA